MNRRSVTKCYPSHSFFRDYRLSTVKGLICGTNSGNWMLPSGAECAPINADYPVTCNESGNGHLHVPRAAEFTMAHEGEYKCCTNDSCPLTAVIFGQLQ